MPMAAFVPSIFSVMMTSRNRRGVFGQGVKAGMRVTQGQVIGFVGQTGWATGPHLHYELRLKGVPLNPFSTDVAAVAPLTGARLKLFDMYAENLLKRIDLMRTVQVAERD